MGITYPRRQRAYSHWALMPLKIVSRCLTSWNGRRRSAREERGWEGKVWTNNRKIMRGKYLIFPLKKSYFFLFLFLLKDNCFTEFVFCQTSTWISHRYIYTPSLLNLPPISLPIPPLEVDTEPLFEFSEPYSKFLLAV